jgi:surfactin synthase thioesterase subunit
VVEPSATMVVALPYSGGSGRALEPLRQYLPADCGLALVDLPGHGRRIGEPCLRDADSVVSRLAAELATVAARRVVLLGYSLGGLLAYDLAVRLSAGGTPPAGLVVCGSRGPQTGVGRPPVTHLPPGEPFLRAAVDMGLAAPEMLELPDLAETFAGVLHADLCIVDSFRYRPGPPLPVPVCVLGFDADWLVPEPMLRAWDAVCQAPPLHLRVAGGHLSVHDHEREFGEAVRVGVQHVLAADPGEEADQ